MGAKLVALANHIVIHGLNPADLPIVMPTGDDTRRYVVLEGNRRLVALRVLENPELLVGAVDARVLEAVRRHGRDYSNTPIENIHCLVVRDEIEARPWIELRHTGQNEGAGIVPWISEEASRYRARSGTTEPYSQALDILERRHLLTPENRRKIPVTSLRRILGTPDARIKLGIDIVKGELILLAEEEQVAKALDYVVRDLLFGENQNRRYLY